MNVELYAHMGDDLMVVNAARSSFGRRKERLTASDIGLIQFLASGCSTEDRIAWHQKIVDCQTLDDAAGLFKAIQHIATHWMPFAHPTVSFYVKAPLFTARQAFRSHVGAACGEGNFAWSEESRRYVRDDPEFCDLEWRQKADNVKQGSGGPLSQSDAKAVSLGVNRIQQNVKYEYETLLAYDVAPEQARAILPQTLMVSWMWTGSLGMFARVYNQRSDSHAQGEIQQLARMIGDEMKKLFPISWEALT